MNDCQWLNGNIVVKIQMYVCTLCEIPQHHKIRWNGGSLCYEGEMRTDGWSLMLSIYLIAIQNVSKCYIYTLINLAFIPMETISTLAFIFRMALESIFADFIILAGGDWLAYRSNLKKKLVYRINGWVQCTIDNVHNSTAVLKLANHFREYEARVKI